MRFIRLNAHFIRPNGHFIRLKTPKTTKKGFPGDLLAGEAEARAATGLQMCCPVVYSGTVYSEGKTP